MAPLIPKNERDHADSLLPHQMGGMLVLGQHALNCIHTLLQMVLRRAERQPDKVVARRVEQVSLQGERRDAVSCGSLLETCSLTLFEGLMSKKIPGTQIAFS